MCFLFHYPFGTDSKCLTDIHFKTTVWASQNNVGHRQSPGDSVGDSHLGIYLVTTKPLNEQEMRHVERWLIWCFSTPACSKDVHLSWILTPTDNLGLTMTDPIPFSSKYAGHLLGAWSFATCRDGWLIWHLPWPRATYSLMGKTDG